MIERTDLPPRQFAKHALDLRRSMRSTSPPVQCPREALGR
ncbi:hypothetical protein LI99_17415 [Mycolicibacterium smegmatis]|uniref:Uncharacterized protein n=1 Tax=Mycolicibacterium smegmatis (strain ATCC 700084 / mc(2)155) TaxID=246196 RepID=A0QY14_MYCS2|nr:hypothetical protein MSMEG_3498 [Mycolicibacterium smegmatis MC2 155]AIU15262.1 hypothetical protein LI99_17415 [Mycolicibacterium smegmatis]AIU08637.1 hypothetical protein LJ00_17410 [Mycolicibacterium smegmatis MC2 155]AIU21885.1 hypothetical protein LI98_17420 [Mycolicibacterium smegmatis]TBH28385.1 hypothetical protein EYS45_29000 [Mycolicibacterium smegmatis MC2 155]